MRLIKYLLIILFLFQININAQKNNLYYKASLYKLTSASAPQQIKLLDVKNYNTQKKVIQKGLLFTYKDNLNEIVKIAGDFSNWKPVKMEKSKNGVWFYFLEDFSVDSKLKYKYLINNIWITDPMNIQQEDDGYGSFVSITNSNSKEESKQISYQIFKNNNVNFRIYNSTASFISIVGDFNNWNPENDLLTKDKNNIWQITKKLQPGIYRYKYVIDGQWVADIYNNQNSGDGTGGVASIIQVK